MADMQFRKATKKALKARIALCGPSGAGKTYSALITAHALADGAPVAVIDTERRSSELYADVFDFDVLPMDRFDPRDLSRALALAAHHGYAVVVIDSLSHFWSGADGMLEQVDNAAKRSMGGNQFGGWKEARPMEREMIDAILAYPGHVVATMRVKTEYVIEEDSRGKKKPVKIGMKPEQRENLDYEFTLVGDMDHEHVLVVGKSRVSSLEGAVIPRPDGSFGRAILDWLNTDAAPPFDVTDLVMRLVSPGHTVESLRGIYQEASAAGVLGSPVMFEGESSTVGKLAGILALRAQSQGVQDSDRAPAATTVREPARDDDAAGTPDPQDPAPDGAGDTGETSPVPVDERTARRVAAYDERAARVAAAESDADLEVLHAEFRAEKSHRAESPHQGGKTLEQLILRRRIALGQGKATPDPFADAPPAGSPAASAAHPVAVTP